MKLKLAIIFGILIWLIGYAITEFFNPVFLDNIPYVNIIVPTTVIAVTVFFGILYIRNIESNEVIEGVLGGIIFIVVDIICDFIFLIIPNSHAVIMNNNYPLHIISTIIITLLITTFLGYLAQMDIDLK